MHKILYRYDTLQSSYTKTNFQSNLNYNGKIVREIGPFLFAGLAQLWNCVTGGSLFQNELTGEI